MLRIILTLSLFLPAWSYVNTGEVFEYADCDPAEEQKSLAWVSKKGDDPRSGVWANITHTFNTYNGCDSIMDFNYKSTNYGDYTGNYKIIGGGILPCKNAPCRVFSANPQYQTNYIGGSNLYPACTYIKSVENTYGFGVELKPVDYTYEPRPWGYVILFGWDGFNGIWDNVGEVYYADERGDPYCEGGQTDKYNQIYDYYGVYDLVKEEKGGRRLRGSAEGSGDEYKLLEAIKAADGPIRRA